MKRCEHCAEELYEIHRPDGKVHLEGCDPDCPSKVRQIKEAKEEIRENLEK